MRGKSIPRLLFIVFLLWTAAGGWATPADGVVSSGLDSLIQQSNLVAPAAPSDLKANAFPGVLPVGLSWKDNSTNETGFTIERSTYGGAFTKVGSVAAGVTSYLDSSVTNGLLCKYRVYANVSIVNSGYSNEAEWLTRPNDPSNLVAKPEEVGGGIDLEWNGNNSYATYQIQKTSQVPNQPTKIDLIKVGTDSKYTDDKVESDGVYSYFVTAWSKTDESNASNTVTLTYMGAPSEVQVLYFPASPKLTLRWKDNTSSETKFVVEMAHSSTGNVTSSEVPANTTEFVDDVLNDLLYMYRVKAVGSNGNYSPYSDVCYWYSPPRTPENFKAEAVSSTEVKLTWDDKSQYESGFKIWRTGDNLIAPIDVGANTTSYSDKGLKPNTKYSYTIHAITSNSEVSEDSPAVSVTTSTASIIKPGNLIQKGGLIIPGLKLDTVLQIGSTSMTVNGVSQEIDPGKSTAPLIIEGRTLLPVRAVIEAYGGTVDWDGTEKKVTVVCNGRTIELWIDSLDTKVNGESKTTVVAPQIINDRTMLPLRFVSENLGLNVDWDDANKRVTISTGS